MSHPVKAMKDWTKEKDQKPRKDRERRTHEEKKIANKPARQKRWKELYETGSLEDGDGEFVDGDVFYDETEERTD